MHRLFFSRFFKLGELHFLILWKSWNFIKFNYQTLETRNLYLIFCIHYFNFWWLHSGNLSAELPKTVSTECCVLFLSFSLLKWINQTFFPINKLHIKLHTRLFWIAASWNLIQKAYFDGTFLKNHLLLFGGGGDNNNKSNLNAPFLIKNTYQFICLQTRTNFKIFSKNGLFGLDDFGYSLIN